MKSCVICHKEFKPNSNSQKCCSPKCAIECSRIRVQRAYLLHKSTNVRHTTCITCQREFSYHHRTDRKERVFCCRSCASKHYINNGTFDTWRHKTRKKQKRIQVSCAWCNSVINVLPRDYFKHLALNMKHCCNRQCRIKYTQKSLTGRTGHRFTESMRIHQRETMISRHNVTNAFMLAKHRTKSKPQLEIYAYVKSHFQQDEFQIEKRITSDNNELFADIISMKRKLIIEFNGDYWHCNPTKYRSNYVHKVKNQTAETIWKNDALRLEKMRELGYHVYVIWEAEYNDLTNDWRNRLTEWVKSHEKTQDPYDQ